KRVASVWDFVKRGEIAILVHVRRDQFGILATHDPVERAAKNVSWNFHARPCGREIQLLQLLVKPQRPPVQVCVVFSLWPEIRELRLLLQNIIDWPALDQPCAINRRRSSHALAEFAGRCSHETDSASRDL